MGGMFTATLLAVFFVPVFFVVVRRIFKGSERQRRMYAHELNGSPAPAAPAAAPAKDGSHE
jgi:multidrug efflux pump